MKIIDLILDGREIIKDSKKVLDLPISHHDAVCLINLLKIDAWRWPYNYFPTSRTFRIKASTDSFNSIYEFIYQYEDDLHCIAILVIVNGKKVFYSRYDKNAMIIYHYDFIKEPEIVSIPNVNLRKILGESDGWYSMLCDTVISFNNILYRDINRRNLMGKINLALKDKVVEKYYKEIVSLLFKEDIPQYDDSMEQYKWCFFKKDHRWFHTYFIDLYYLHKRGGICIVDKSDITLSESQKNILFDTLLSNQKPIFIIEVDPDTKIFIDTDDLPF